MDTTCIVKGLAIIGIAAAVACSSSNGGGGGGDGGSSSSSSGGSVSCSSLCARCSSLCAESSGCGKFLPHCESQCSKLEPLAGKAGCSNELDSLLECIDASADICNASCGFESNALGDCTTPYCTSNPQECEGVQ